MVTKAITWVLTVGEQEGWHTWKKAVLIVLILLLSLLLLPLIVIGGIIRCLFIK